MNGTLQKIAVHLRRHAGVSHSILLLSFISVLSFAQDGSWQQKQSLGVLVTARSGGVGFSIGSKGYIGTGYDSTGTYRNDFWEYDSYSKSWTQKANFAGSPRSGASGFSIDGKGYIGTGHNAGNYYNDFWVYDTATNAWTRKADFSGGARSAATGFAVTGIQGGSKGYMGTGIDAGGAAKNDFWEYDPIADAWAQKSNFGGGKRAGATSFNESTVGYLGTGVDSAGNFHNDFWLYSAAIDTWSQKANFGGNPRSGATGFSLNGKGYIGTGSNGNNYYNDFWEYDATLNTWTPVSNFTGGARSGAVSFSIGNPGMVYVGTGTGAGVYYNDLWQYTGLGWTQQPGFGGTNARYHAVGFSIGTKGYIGTGDDGTLKKDFWEYDPAANTWTQLADFGGTARSGATGFSIGNKGYLGMGSAYDNNFKNDFWEYDPATNTWLQKGNFPGLGKLGATGFSIGSKGYMGTGTYRTQSINDFWEYDPSTDGWTQKANFAGDPREYATGMSVGTKGYIGLGGVNDFWEYDPGANTWTQKANFAGGARTAATGFSIGAKGYIGVGGVNDFWEYDPVTDIWTQKANFSGGARAAASGFSAGGKGYIGFGKATDGLKNDLWEYSLPDTSAQFGFVTIRAFEQNSSIVVEWTAQEDHSVQGYQIEKSLDGRSFDIAATQKAGGNGQSISYSWVDNQPAVSTNFYRIVAVGADGEIDTSKIVTVSTGADESLYIYPNPITSNVFTLFIVNNKKETFRIRLCNDQGQQIRNYTISHPGGSSAQTVNLPFTLSNSFYIVNIERENGKRESIKLLSAK